MTSLPASADPKAGATEALAAGRAAFNRGQFFAAHERWEDAWRTAAGPPRTILQGLIQIAAGLHHLHQGRTGPAARLLVKGVRKLPLSTPGAPAAGTVRLEIDALALALAELKLAGFAVAITRLVDSCTTSFDPVAAPTSSSRIRVPRL